MSANQQYLLHFSTPEQHTPYAVHGGAACTSASTFTLRHEGFQELLKLFSCHMHVQ